MLATKSADGMWKILLAFKPLRHCLHSSDILGVFTTLAKYLPKIAWQISHANLEMVLLATLKPNLSDVSNSWLARCLRVMVTFTYGERVSLK